MVYGTSFMHDDLQIYKTSFMLGFHIKSHVIVCLLFQLKFKLWFEQKLYESSFCQIKL